MITKLLKKKLATLSKSPFITASPAESPKIKSSLTFATGEKFDAVSFGYNRPITTGEVVFTTSLVGYTESLTDPSYHGQILVFSQPLIGNYGVPAPTLDQYGLSKYFESEKIQVKGVVVNDYAAKYSHWQAVESLGQWCIRHKIPAISGVDTRAVVTLLREHGSKCGSIAIGEEGLRVGPPVGNSDSSSWMRNVSRKDIQVFNPSGSIKIALIDCGAKQNIIRCLIEKGASVTAFPHDYDISSRLEEYDGVFLSNGPGDPRVADVTVANTKKLLDKSSRQRVPTPIFGICMGHQLLGLAAGFPAYKLPFGNRGHNQPVLNLINGGCIITSQNHGYALDDSNPPVGWVPYFRNANDGSNEGIKHQTLPFASVQFHPEAMGGPLDTQYLFDDFIQDVKTSILSKRILKVSSKFQSKEARN
jgi:carbamoyl-phosphate synthase small subunit